MSEEMDDIGAIGDTEDHDKQLADLLARVLESTKLMEVVETKLSVGQIYFLCRVEQKSAKELMSTYGFPILEEANKPKTFDCFIGTQYLVDKRGEHRYAWVFGVGSDDLPDASRRICDIVSANAPKLEVTEAPLVGPPSPSGSVKGGRRGVSATSYGA
jgi:hypothetical protein